MLTQLTLSNFVLVDALDIDFGRGLSTVTGESGAGKSILLSALGLLLGDRASTDVIRPGADRADVSAEFDVSALPQVRDQLESEDLTSDDDENLCLIRRVVTPQGRSRAYVNGVPVPAQTLRRLGDHLVDVHGQNEHIQLADRGVQLALLDDYAGTANAAADVATLYQDWQATLQKISDLEEELANSDDRRELLTYQLSELEEFGLEDSEFDRLESEHKRLASAQEILTTLDRANASLDEDAALRASAAEVDAIDDEDENLTSARDNLATALGLLEDAKRDLARYQDRVVLDPETLAEVSERLDTALDLARKHKVQPSELAEHTATLRSALDGIESDSGELEGLRVQAEETEAAFRKKATALSKKRKKASTGFAKAVTGYMHQLGIGDGAFSIEFSDTEGASGIDRIEYQVVTNPDFPAGPLTQIASGGEQTRISLSIQIVAAEHSELPCLILDEADVGVGGTTADTVGRILRALAQHTQVICVTHAPQVAALGNHHYRVVKEGAETQIHHLDTDSRVEELARMLAGADINEKTRDYAQTLLAAANE